MPTSPEKRSKWVGYLRVSTPEQAARDLSLPAQRRAVYVAGNGAKNVAIALNERGLSYRRGSPWSKDLVLHVLDEPAVAGTYLWGRWSGKRKKRRDESEWLQETAIRKALGS